MEKVMFTVFGVPKAKGRPRFNYRTGHAYTPETTRSWEQNIIEQSIKFRPQMPFEGAITLIIRFYLPIPRSYSKKKTSDALYGIYKHTKRPDLENLVKCIDALNGVYWKDDAQIDRLHAIKCYGEPARVEIEVACEE